MILHKDEGSKAANNNNNNGDNVEGEGVAVHQGFHECCISVQDDAVAMIKRTNSKGNNMQSNIFLSNTHDNNAVD